MTNGTIHTPTNCCSLWEVYLILYSNVLFPFLLRLLPLISSIDQMVPFGCGETIVLGEWKERNSMN